LVMCMRRVRDCLTGFYLFFSPSRKMYNGL
jgi:hypothetical protein